jgi:hypothetical protein
MFGIVPQLLIITEEVFFIVIEAQQPKTARNAAVVKRSEVYFGFATRERTSQGSVRHGVGRTFYRFL